MLSNQSQASARFDVAVAHLLATEGGFVNHPADPGGATKFGISLRFLLAENRSAANHLYVATLDRDLDGDLDVDDIRALTPDDARTLYHRCFWQALGCDDLPAPIGEMLFDQGVNGGNTAAIKILQKAINSCIGRGTPLPVDGLIGPATRAAAKRVVSDWGIEKLVQSFRSFAKLRYRMLVAEHPQFGPFLKGWLVRADALGRTS